MLHYGLPKKPAAKLANARAGESRIPMVRFVVAFCAAIMLLNCAIVVKRAVTAYRESITAGQTSAGRLTHTLSDHIELTFFAVDLALKRAIERQHFNALFGNNLREDIQNNFIQWVNETPQISAMLMTDETGDITAIYRKVGYKTWMEGRETLAREGYFKELKNSRDEDALYVGWHPSWLQQHAGFVIMARKIIKVDGSFGGIVLIAVNSDYVLNFFESVEGNSATRLVLMRDESPDADSNGLLINQLETEEDVATLKRILDQQKTALASDGVVTVVHEERKEASGFTDSVRMYSFDHIPSLHLVVGVVSYGQDILSTWRDGRINDLIFLAIFALFVLAIALFALAVSRQVQRVQHSEHAAVLASQAKSEFLANMSHELRTPLNAIIGFSEMMEAGYFGKLNPKQKERVHDINYCGTHLLELINDILEFSKGEAGKIELREEKVSVPKIIRDTVRIFAERSRKEGVTITARADDNLPLLLADGRKIKQILLNLLSNAVKFTNEGGSVEVACWLDRENNFLFSVTDTGIGMREEDIPKALSAFGQVHHDMPGKAAGGTGLGLPLCKMFAELHGGELIIQSIEGVGTKVIIVLPGERVISSPTGLAPAGVPKPQVRPVGIASVQQTEAEEAPAQAELLMEEPAPAPVAPEPQITSEKERAAAAE